MGVLDSFNMGLRRSLIVPYLPKPLAAYLRGLQYAFSVRNYVDETELVATLADDLPPANSVLVDVGAHHGSVTERYLRMGWSVVAYEPDPSNRNVFQTRIGYRPGLQLSAAAVSDQPASSALLFSSQVSSGISSLSAFHNSHKPAAEVTVVTLEEDLHARGVTRVDFLKIDIEGFDFHALRGFDWSYAPRFVLYEFEDRKTLPLGYSLTDSSAYVARQGYHLIYSVWEPIVEYGTRHRWRGLFRTPPADIARCWGNVLCFRDEVDAEACLQIARTEGETWRGSAKRSTKRVLGPLRTRMFNR